MKDSNDPQEPVYNLKEGLIKYSDGSEKSTKAFDFLKVSLDSYDNLELTASQVLLARNHLLHMKTGLSAMAPMLCAGPVRCVFRYRCPLIDRTRLTPDGRDIDFTVQNIRSFPIMKQCLVEREYINIKRQEYMEEYDVHEESPTEIGMINKLAELDLYEYRATLVLAHGDDRSEGVDLLKRQVTGIDPVSGREITRLEIHPAFELMEKIHRMRDQILSAMVGTRREKYKQAAALKEGIRSDPSSITADLMNRLKKLDVVEAEFEEVLTPDQVDNQEE